MGKKKRGTNKKGKSRQERREEIQARRERQLEVVDHPQEEQGRTNNDPEQTPFENESIEILIGDRVFCRNCDALKEGDSYRGSVRDITITVDGIKAYSYLPINRGDEEENRIRLSRKDLITDTYPLFPRFNVGDPVIINNDNGFEPAIVRDIYPPDLYLSKTGMFPYRVSMVYDLEPEPFDDDNGDYRPEFSCVPSDKEEDDCIRGRLDKFRFKVGDKVFFATEDDGWVCGHIAEINKYYGFYACEYRIGSNKRKENKRYNVCYDDDEHIALVESSPRQRLFDAIHQNCSYEHFVHLISRNKLDVSSFKDLVLDEAIKSACYGALLWLQEHASILLGSITDSEGGGILHQIARSPNAHRFFEALKLNDGKTPSIKVEIGGRFSKPGKNVLLDQKNNKGQIFLFDIVNSGNIRCLEIILSGKGRYNAPFYYFLGPHRCTSIDNMSKDGKNTSLIQQYMHSKGQWEMCYLLEKYHEKKIFSDLYNDLIFHHQKADEEKIDIIKKVSQFTGYGDEVLRRRFFSFLDEDDNRLHETKNVIRENISNLPVIRWLIDQSEELSMKFHTITRADCFEYIQTEMYSIFSCTEEDRLREYIDLDLVSFAAHEYTRVYFNEKVEEMASTYYSCFLMRLHSMYSNGRETNFINAFVNAIEEELSRKSIGHEEKTIYNFKKSCLTDDKNLSGRLDVLNYLVKEKSQSPPNALDVIKWRQCGVLRWLVNESYVNLDDPAYSSEHLLSASKISLKCTNNTKINRLSKSITVAILLAFACVEYDDLYSLQWILGKSSEVKEKEFYIVGWNLYHACAYFGRTEIFIYLNQTTTLKSSMNEVCKRKPFMNYFASHIAIKRGFTKLAEYLLDSGCPSHTTEGENIDELAKDSNYVHVYEWGISRENPDLLDLDIKRLLSLLEHVPCNIKAIKEHIMTTKCMNVARWKDITYNVNENDTGNFFVMTYQTILERIYDVCDASFIFWFLQTLEPNILDDGDCHQVRLFWKGNEYFHGKLTISLQSAVEEIDDKDFSHLLRLGILSQSKICDTSDIHPMIQHALQYHSRNEDYIKTVNTYRKTFLKQMILHEVIDTINRYILKDIFKNGVSSDDIEECKEVFLWAIQTFRHCSNVDYEVPDYFILNQDGKYKVSNHCWCYTDYDKSPLSHLLIFYRQSKYDVQANQVMALEGYEELIAWTLLPPQNTWTIEDEVITARVAAYFGQTGVLNLFLENTKIDVQLKSSVRSRIIASLLGAAESGRKKDMAGYLKTIALSQDETCIDVEACKEFKDDKRAKLEHIGSTLVGCVVGYLVSEKRASKNISEVDNDDFEMIDSILNHTCADPRSITVTIQQLLDELVYRPPQYQMCLEIFKYLVESHQLNVWKNQECVSCLISRMMDMTRWKISLESFVSVINDFLNFAIVHGVDIQNIFLDYHQKGSNHDLDEAVEALDNAKMRQCKIWSQYGIVQKGSLSVIQSAIDNVEANWCNSEGLSLVHLVAAFDRKDVLIWLLEEKKVSLNQLDGDGRSVSDVAKASAASNVLEWLSLRHAGKMLSTFIASQYRRKRTQRHYLSFLNSLRLLQARCRGRKVWRLYHGVLLQRLEQARQFNTIWSKAIIILDKSKDSSPWISWKFVKIQEDDQASLLEEGVDVDTLNHSLAVSPDMIGPHEELQDVEEEIEYDGILLLKDQHGNEKKPATECIDQLERIQLTKDVVKWLRKCDPKYREFFQRRMKQLADGDRSRILAKGLTGCKTRIFETYLEQKSGFRILWTKMSVTDIRIWYVAKHDDVSRHIKLIDEAEKRSKRQLVSASKVQEIDDSEEFTVNSNIILDPKGNTPMKVYEVTYNNIERLQDIAWHPPLYLTKEERDIVESSGTVLIVGRSGCGKTICICNRMDYDWRRSGSDPSFSQLFISRSKKLRNFVKENVEGFVGETIESRRFMSFPELLRSLETKLPMDEEQSYLYVPSQKMNFTRFKSEVYYSEGSSVGALTIWKNIHVFIKGSVESLSNEGGLSESEYMSLGARQCKLSPEQRTSVYKVYEKYTKYMKEKMLWDDCDWIRSIVRRLKLVSRDDSDLLASIRESKIYVDEIQDYLQIEILLFFMLSGAGGLFLAGDPAQSVVDGANFQFKDVRTVGFYLFGEEQKKMIPNKPEKLSLNFRSHSGILQVASAVLDCLSSAFPDSIAQTGSDKAVFQGPRPSLLYKICSNSLRELSQKVEGIVFLTHDENVSCLRRALQQYPLVFGIREAKGLEFQSVVIVDFFSELSKKYQKVWRDLLLGRQVDVDKFPEIESHLKLLYTGITRSIQRLFFAETSPSVAGQAFVRWSSTTTVTAWNRTQALAVQQSVNDVEGMTLTKDEWRSAGLDNTIMAEQEEIELVEAEAWLEKALYCFSKSGDTELARKARTHRKAICFQRMLATKLQDDRENDSEILSLELKAVDVMEQLLWERLILEARRLALSLMPMMSKPYSENQFVTHLLDKFPCEKEMEGLLL